jgi:TetR/AcrR family transcriptional regulator, mexJK operon transcriptional repressor
MAETANTSAGAGACEAAKTPRLGRPTLSNEDLLDRALDLFLEHGFEGVSIEAITTAAGMAKRTLYARYEDKETLFRAALTRAIDKWLVPVERLRAAETDDLEATLLGIGQILIDNVLSPAGLRLLRLTNAVSASMPEIATYNVQRGTEPTQAYITDLLRRRITFTDAHVLNAEEAAMAFIHLVVGGPSSMAGWGITQTRDEIDRHTRTSVQLLLHGLAPQLASTSALHDENRRLRQMLTDALLANAALKEQHGD